MKPAPGDPEVDVLLERFERAHVEVRVFGGFAVGIDPRIAELEEADLRSPDDPVRLAAQIRSTGDVDIAVIGSMKAAEGVLEVHGYRKDPRVGPPPARWVGALAVDLVEANAASSSELERLLAFLVARPDGARSDGVPVFAPGDLVVLKAVAYRDRFERRDLADVGRIALLDEIAEPIARERLLTLAPELPVFASRALEGMRAAFADEHAIGAVAFLEHSERGITGLKFDEERELRVCATVARAVRAMIDPALAAGA